MNVIQALADGPFKAIIYVILESMVFVKLSKVGNFCDLYSYFFNSFSLLFSPLVPKVSRGSLEAPFVKPTCRTKMIFG